nr:hypothetical protein [Tanacetum cinerariifolium]
MNLLFLHLIEKRDEKKRLDHLKQDQTMLVIKRFSKRKKMTTTVVNNSIFRGFFGKQRLTGTNFIDWYRQLRIVLSAEDKLNYLEHLIPAAPVPAFAGQQVPPEAHAAHAAWIKGQKEIVVLMLMTMKPDIKRNLENLGKTVNELHAMLKLHEKTLPNKYALALHAIRTCKGLRRSRKLKPEALSLYVGDGHHAGVEAIGSYPVLFEKEVENQLGKTIKSLRSNRGGRYMSQEFLDHLKEHGIISHRNPPYVPQHNGVSKRRNRTLLDMVRSMMSQTTLPKSFWNYALESATRIINMVLTKKFEKTPYEIWHGSIKCIFIGYPKETMGYYFYYPLKNKIRVARNAEFLENGLMTQEASGSLEYLEIIQEEDTHPTVNTSLDHDEDDQEIDEPQIDLPPDGKTVGSKWLFKKKTDMDGVVHSYKARLVAKGFTQAYGVDYEETFSTVADIQAIRILVAIGDLHWTAVKNILKYLCNTKDMFLVYGGDIKREFRVSCYTDDGYLTDANHLKSQTGYVFILNGGVVD